MTTNYQQPAVRTGVHLAVIDDIRVGCARENESRINAQIRFRLLQWFDGTRVYDVSDEGASVTEFYHFMRKDGSVNDIPVAQLVRALGWDRRFESLAHDPAGGSPSKHVGQQVWIETKPETYNGQERTRVAGIYPGRLAPEQVGNRGMSGKQLRALDATLAPQLMAIPIETDASAAPTAPPAPPAPAASPAKPQQQPQPRAAQVAAPPPPAHPAPPAMPWDSGADPTSDAPPPDDLQF